jgi:Raf kinase inhibitor-like YbhB/YbcL family protein
MTIGSKTSSVVGRALRSVHAGVDKLATRRLARNMPPTLEVHSSDFAGGGELPASATIDGAGTAPTITWSGLPERARSIVVVCEDPDAPLPQPYVHWMVYGIPADTTLVDATVAAPAREGKNSALRTGFAPAAPPHGHGVHHFHFQVFAVDGPIDLEPGTGRGTLLDAMRGHVAAWGEVIGTYSRAPVS